VEDNDVNNLSSRVILSVLTSALTYLSMILGFVRSLGQSVVKKEEIDCRVLYTKRR
jgi:hypothetical protein